MRQIGVYREKVEKIQINIILQKSTKTLDLQIKWPMILF